MLGVEQVVEMNGIFSALLVKTLSRIPRWYIYHLHYILKHPHIFFSVYKAKNIFCNNLLFNSSKLVLILGLHQEKFFF